ncbi:glycoside hydrolase family 88 protein [Pseudonocardia sp. MH-G8]|uniref:glycoside hydrolase family 88 protein n=1 Tax=Pseudonocardia sp. MH-G8 TaxID=1854588 RepID=UPI0018E92087|nr:glycoside hydrolase family 88 protein [Pseudonocardia sp. MH-G8]
MSEQNLESVVKRVLTYTITIDRQRDDWQRASAMSGVLACGDDQEVAVVKGWLDRAVATQNSQGNLSFSEPEYFPAGSHVGRATPHGPLSSSFGYPLLELHQRTGDARYLEAAERQVAALMRAPRTSDGGIWSHKDGPELWVDFVYMMCPFLARFGTVTGDTAYVDEAFHQFDVHVQHLVDPQAHLARHAWRETPNSFPQSTFWSRGNGWLVAAAVQLLELCPDHEKSRWLADAAVRTLSAMARHQDRTGYLRNILDDPDSPLESSGSVMFAYAAAKAVEQGLVDPELIDAAVRAVRVVSGEVSEDGAVRGVSVPPGGPGVPFGVTPFGQGFFLLACHALRKPLGLPG